jgi:hypothetical protein
MSQEDLQLLREFRCDTPEPDAETSRGIYELATGTSATRRGRLVLRVAAVGAVAAAVALGVLSVLPGSGPSAVERAQAALTPSAGTILHTVVITTGSATNRAQRTETWQLNAPPYDQRQVGMRGAWPLESATSNGRPEVYYGRLDTIYTVPPGTELPPPRPPKDGAQRILDVMRNHLASGKVREERLIVDGRDVIRFVSSVWKGMILVDADTYEPIEWRMVSDEGIQETNRFQTYELLPATKANLALLSLRAQHPGATIDPSLKIEGIGPKK